MWQFSAIMPRVNGEACTWDVHISHALQFLGMIPDSPGYIGAVMERIEENRTLDGWARKPRKLADFRYYLRFDRYVNEFWGTAGEDTKDYFFPAYLGGGLPASCPCGRRNSSFCQATVSITGMGGGSLLYAGQD